MKDRVIIVGAGPAGLVCALRLVQQGVPVLVLEQHDRLLDDPRAATTHPATLELLDDLGVVEQVKDQGLVAKTFQFWDRPSGEKIAEFDHTLLEGETRHPYVVQCEQFKLARILCDVLERHPLAEIRFNSKVTGISQSEDRVRVSVDVLGERSLLECGWLVGCDGGRSIVRKSAGIEFEGFTWSERFLVLTTPFDFERERGYSYRSYFADPDEWCNCFKVRGYSQEGLWRTVFPAPVGKTDEEVLSMDAAQAQLQKFFPRDEPYEIVHRNIYSVHQRVASTFRKGRILLAGDSAHVNNPIGGMGLNGGVQDAFNLGGKLAAVVKGVDEASVLDLYDLQRRTITTQFVQEQTIQNKKRLEAKDPETRAKNFAELRATAADPVRAKQFLLRSSMIASLRQANSLKM